jgi:hypothetical protein
MGPAELKDVQTALAKVAADLVKRSLEESPLVQERPQLKTIFYQRIGNLCAPLRIVENESQEAWAEKNIGYFLDYLDEVWGDCLLPDAQFPQTHDLHAETIGSQEEHFSPYSSSDELHSSRD